MKKTALGFAFSLLFHGMFLLLVSAPWWSQSPRTESVDLINLSLEPLRQPPRKAMKKAVGKTKAPSPPAIPEQRPVPANAPVVEEKSPETHEAELIGATDLSEIKGGASGVPTAAGVYLSRLKEQITRHQFYPPASRTFQEEGVVRIRLTLDRSGSLLKAELTEGSPYKRLNDAAMTAAAKSAPFASFPDEVPYKTWKILVPVRFALSN